MTENRRESLIALAIYSPVPGEREAARKALASLKDSPPFINTFENRQRERLISVAVHDQDLDQRERARKALIALRDAPKVVQPAPPQTRSYSTRAPAEAWPAWNPTPQTAVVKRPVKRGTFIVTIGLFALFAYIMMVGWGWGPVSTFVCAWICAGLIRGKIMEKI